MQASNQNIVIRSGVSSKIIVNIIVLCVFMDIGKQNKTGRTLPYSGTFSDFCILRITK